MAKSRWFSLLVVFVLLCSWLLTNIDFGYAGNSRHVLIYESNQEVINHFKNSGFPIIETYDSFFLSLVNSQQEDFLKTNKVPYTYIRGIGSIQFGGYEFKPDIAKNIVYPRELAGKIPVYEPQDEALFLLQFIGPVKHEWTSELSPEEYQLFPMGTFAFLVKTKVALANELRSRREVLMAGLLPPILKVSPELIEMGSNSVDLQLITTGDFLLAPFLQQFGISFGNAVFENIGKMGILSLKDIHTNLLGTMALHTRILSINQKHDVEFLCADAAQVINVRDTSNADKLGLTGQGQIVAVLDSGLSTGDTDTMHRAFRPENLGDPDRVVAFEPDLGWESNWIDPITGNYRTHGTEVAGIIMGFDPDFPERRGMAYEAKLVVQKIDFTGSGGGSSLSLSQLFEHARSHGAYIHNNSWGSVTSGGLPINAYSANSWIIDYYQWLNKDFNIVFAAGNDGPGAGTITIEPNSKNNVAVGAMQNNKGPGYDPDRLASFSSKGPAADGRIKPDVVAPAQNILAPYSTAGNPNNYRNFSGTSAAAPVVSGALALLREKYGNASTSALLKALLINGAVRFGLKDHLNVEHTCPNSSLGWGRTDVEASTQDTDMLYWDVTGSEGLQTSGTWTQTIEVHDSTQPLRINMVYTDYPGTIGAGKALINDLDLVVTYDDGSGGTIYRGNQLDANKNSIPNPPNHDDRNNVEEIFIPAPQEGDWIIQVYARDVQEGDPDTNRQPFAVVARGGTTELPPGEDPPDPSILLEILPNHREVIQGDSTSYVARVSVAHGAEGMVSLDLLVPQNVDITFDFPYGNTFFMNSGLTRMILFNIYTSDDTPLDIYTMFAVANLNDPVNGMLSAQRYFTMTVIREPTYHLFLRPPHARIDQGESTYTRVLVQPRFEFDSPVYFEVFD